MQISVTEDYPGYANFRVLGGPGKLWQISIDGGPPLKRVVAADDEAGTVVAYRCNEAGKLLLNETGDDVLTETLYGKVVILLNGQRPSLPDTPLKQLRDAFEAAGLMRGEDFYAQGDHYDVVQWQAGFGDRIVARCSTGELAGKRCVAIAMALNHVRHLLAGEP